MKRTPESPHLAALPARWRERAEHLYRYGRAKAAAAIWKLAADELDEALQEQADELLNLTDASRKSGYSPDHLGRLIRDSKLTNHGARHAPRIRVGDLPRRRSRSLVENTDDGYDPIADARSLTSRRNGGANGDPKSHAK